LVEAKIDDYVTPALGCLQNVPVVWRARCACSDLLAISSCITSFSRHFLVKSCLSLCFV